MSDVFGTIFTPRKMEDALMVTLQTWMPTYLAEIERQTLRDSESLPHPQSWANSTSEFNAIPGDEIMPLVVVICTGLAGEPERHGDGRYRAPWACGVGVFTSGRDQDSSRGLAYDYGAAIRALIVQHQSLGGLPGAGGIDWVEERYDDVDIEEERTLGSARIVFSVWIEDVVSDNLGPVDPDPLPDHHEPYPDDAVVHKVITTYNGKEDTVSG